MVKATKIAIKILYVSLIIGILGMSIMPVFAATDPKDFSGTAASSDFDGYIRTILGAVTAIGIGAAVIILVVIGIKYLVGSAEERAEYKKTMIPYIVGAILVGGAPAIASAVYNAFKS